VALTRRLRARFRTLPIVALTAFVGEDEEVACRRAGVSAYLRKPSGLHVLDATLRSLLAGGAAPAPPPAPADALDRDRLGGHLQVLGAGALTAVVEAFDRSVAACLAKLEAASAGGPTSELEDALHALRGAASQLGLDGVAQRAGALEVAARTGDTARLRAEAARFRADLQSARRALGAVVDDLTGRWSSAAGD
jgi:two-component system sensor histidine kinase TorS